MKSKNKNILSLLEKYAKEDYEPDSNPLNQIISSIEIPKSLFRYRKYSEYTEELEYMESEVVNNIIYMGSPKNFNDPYDCIPNIINKMSNSLSLNFGNWLTINKNYISRLYSEATNKLTPPEIVSKNHKILESMVEMDRAFMEIMHNHIYQSTDNSSVIYYKLYKYFIKEMHQNMKIACLTTKNDNMPMWSHYANNHQGICIEYDLSNISFASEGNVSLLPVQYTKKVASYIFGLDDENGYKFNSLIKHVDWEYEDEWRLLSINNEPIKYNKIPIKTIYLGIKSSEKCEKQIKDLIRKSGKNIQLKKCEVGVNGFFAKEIIVS